MKLDILFWCYKDLEVCRNKLQIFKKFNPNSKIFCLFGGPLNESECFYNSIHNYVDDFYPLQFKDSFWKWIHGDLALLHWYENRGRHLTWESLVIAQWDLLALTSFDKIFSGIKKDELYLPNYGDITKNIETFWFWTSHNRYKQIKPDSPLKVHMHPNYQNFKNHISIEYDYNAKLKLCTFMFAVLPKIFFEKYGQVKNIEIGFLEYKIPTYAKIFGIKAFRRYFGEYRIIPSTGIINKFKNINNQFDKKPLNANKHEIQKKFIEKEIKKNGWRLFHPVTNIFESYLLDSIH